MIVDDDPHIQLALRQIVESVGHRVVEASNGQEAIELFEEFHPELVITDVFMPQTDGIETIRAIRQIQPEARIIGWNYLDSVVVLGANLALQKPFTCSQLLSAIDRLLGARAPLESVTQESAAAC
jgi:CheY-like chemotaxis protein